MTVAYAGAAGTAIRRPRQQGVQRVVKGSTLLWGEHEGVLLPYDASSASAVLSWKLHRVHYSALISCHETNGVCIRVV